MPLRVDCQCGETLTMPDNKAGMEVLCPVCNQLITIPSSRKVTPPPPPASGAAAKPSSPPATQTTPPPTPKPKPKGPPPLVKASKADPSPRKGKQQVKESKPKPVARVSEKKQAIAPAVGDKVKSPAAARPAPRPPGEKPVPAPSRLPGPPPRNTDSSQKMSDAKAVEKKQVPVPPPRARERVDPAKDKATSKRDSTPAPPPLPLDNKKENQPDQRQRPVPPPAPPQMAATSTPAGQSEPPEIVRGVEHDPGKKWTVYQLAGILAGLGLVGLYPAVMEVVRHFRQFDSQGVESWAWFVIFIAGIQIVYALYLFQLPDWSTTRVVMIVSAAESVLYAMGMGVALMARDDNAIIAALGLEAQQAEGYVGLWCCMMTLMMSLLTYFLVRASLRWQRAYELATAGR